MKVGQAPESPYSRQSKAGLETGRTKVSVEVSPQPGSKNLTESVGGRCLPDQRSSLLLGGCGLGGGAHSVRIGGLSSVRSGRTPPSTAVCGVRYAGQPCGEGAPHSVQPEVGGPPGSPYLWGMAPLVSL